MRWRFVDKNFELEMANRLKLTERIDAFWRSFEKDVDNITSSSGNCAQWVSKELPKVSEELIWELSPEIDNVRRFVITPENNYSLHPMVATMIERAPLVPGFRFMSHREPVEADNVIDVVTARSGAWLADLRILATMTDSNSIDLVFLSSQFEGLNNDDDMGYCFTLSEVILGQLVVEEWIEKFETRTTKPAGINGLKSIFGAGKKADSTDGFDVINFRMAVSSLRGKILDKIPKQPLWQIGSDSAASSCAVLEFKRPEARRKTGSTFLPQVILAAIPPPACFTSERFSRFGENFCYLKIDESESTGDEALDRGELEEIFDAALREAAVGCVTGGGWGPIYNFIDLALTDVEIAIPVLRDVSAQVSLSKSTWLRFLDTKLSQEWVGMYPDTPQPDLSPDW